MNSYFFTVFLLGKCMQQGDRKISYRHKLNIFEWKMYMVSNWSFKILQINQFNFGCER